MHGIIFAELKKYVDTRLGGGAWDGLLREAGMPGRLFMPVEEYPDVTAVALVTAAARITKLDAQVLLQDFGRFIATDLLKMYASRIRPEWRTLDVVEHTEETIHRVVRQRNAGARPPELKCVRTSPGEVVIHYRSGRRMCGVAKGIVLGMADHFRETVAVTEEDCMLRGGDECRITARKTA